MQRELTGKTTPQWPRCVLVALIAILTMAPWWRNHRYLRDFYDYGLVMSGVGRIAAGERPYIDFTTPIQTGIFLFNGWAEKLGDGTYRAMTHGAAVLTLIGVLVLAGIYLRRWPVGAAATMAGALVAMTASQHTIIWHNAVGALCIAVAASGAAMAPVLQRAQWPWHLLTAIALVLGGLTKLNSHLVAVCGVLAWALYAGFVRRVKWPRVLATLAFTGLCGLLLPVAIELAWTGAPLRTWWYNVVALPFGSRSGDFAAVFHGGLYFTIRHDYYGSLPFAPLGALGVLVTMIFAATAVRTHGWRQGIWAVAAAGFAVASGAGLLATNYEIAYLAMGAWFALIAALWLGFELRCTGRWFYGGLVVPAFFVGTLAWHSAWQGQRSQFGYSRAPRSEYKAGESIAPDFHYLTGTFVPPEIANSMHAAAAWRSVQPEEVRRAIFYGPSLEWLERCWPTLKLPGMPLWMHGGTSYGPLEEQRLLKALSAEGPYRHVLVPEARDYWGPVITPELKDRYELKQEGPVWFRYRKLPAEVVSWRPLEFLHAFGGNVNAMHLVSTTMTLHSLSDGRGFLGVEKGRGEILLDLPSYRAQGEAVLRRLPGPAATGEGKVHFEAFSIAGGNDYPRWSTELALTGNEMEQVVRFPVDCGGSPLRFRVTIPEELAGRVTAGWRALTILHSIESAETPPALRIGAHDLQLASAGIRAALLPSGWKPAEVYVRDGRLQAGSLELRPGGEIWIKMTGLFTEIAGTAIVAADTKMAVDPVVRVLYCKGAKLDVMVQSAIREPSRQFDFKAWSAEQDGWLVIMHDSVNSAPPVSIRLNSVKAAD